MKICDLHCHSHFSDGTCSPAELIDLAQKQGLSALALTDHNTSKGLEEFTAAAVGSGVEAVPGCEFTTAYDGAELHIVGLFLPPASWPEVEDYVEIANMAKIHSNHKLIAALQKAGYAITEEEVAASTDAPVFNRAHVAAILVKKGYYPSLDAAFKTVLSEKDGFYEPPKRHSAQRTIRFIKDIGGVAVWAHPLYQPGDYALAEKFLPEAKAAGLDAMETLYSRYDEETTARAVELAERFGVKQSGGSDFHGGNKPDISIGTGTGNLCIPYALCEELKTCRNN